MNKFNETIQNYEYVTAGRYYSEEQKKSIFHLSASANFLTEEEEAALFKTLFAPETEEYKTITDCLNGLLMAAIVDDGGYLKEILKNRSETLKELSKKSLFESKESWLHFQNSKRSSAASMLEKAVHAYGINDKKTALGLFKELAESCHVIAIKFAAALCREANDINGEITYLILYSRIAENLFYDKLPAEFEDRMQSIWKDASEEVIESAYDKSIFYFDEEETIKHIGFNLDGR